MEEGGSSTSHPASGGGSQGRSRGGPSGLRNCLVFGRGQTSGGPRASAGHFISALSKTLERGGDPPGGCPDAGGQCAGGRPGARALVIR